jgi:hypothetical protein
MKLKTKRFIPSLNSCHSLRKPGRIFQDPESQASCQVLFKILSQILIIPLNKIFQGETGSYLRFVQVLVEIFLNSKKQDPTRIHSGFYSGS